MLAFASYTLNSNESLSTLRKTATAMAETSDGGAPPQRMSRAGNGDAGDLENGAIIEPKWVSRTLVLVVLGAC